MIGLELLPLAITFAGIVYGFGAQSDRITVLKQNIQEMAKAQRDLVQEVHELVLSLAVLHKDVEYLKEKAKERRNTVE